MISKIAGYLRFFVKKRVLTKIIELVNPLTEVNSVRICTVRMVYL